MDSNTAVLDACVLYPAPLRDVLMELGIQGLYRARWTDEIQDEWIRNLLKQRPDIRMSMLTRTRQLMVMAMPDALVTGHMKLIDQLKLPDPDDRHVLAAAIISKAAMIVTFNLKDFPHSVLISHGIQAMTPDDFLSQHFDLAQPEVCQAIKRLRSRLTKPKMDVVTYLEVLSTQNVPAFVERLRRVEKLL